MFLDIKVVAEVKMHTDNLKALLSTTSASLVELFVCIRWQILNLAGPPNLGLCQSASIAGCTGQKVPSH